MATTKEHNADDARFAKEIGRLTDAIRDLTHGTRTQDSDEDPAQRRLIQRVDFGYRALGTLMGRVSTGFSAEFDVAVFGARWDPRRSEILLPGLPDDVGWIELRTARRTETVRVRRGRDEHDDAADADAADADAKDRRGGQQPPRISPETFTPGDPIDSVLGLRRRRGPVVALGPRIAPRPRYA